MVEKNGLYTVHISDIECVADTGSYLLMLKSSDCVTCITNTRYSLSSRAHVTSITDRVQYGSECDDYTVVYDFLFDDVPRAIGFGLVNNVSGANCIGQATVQANVIGLGPTSEKLSVLGQLATSTVIFDTRSKSLTLSDGPLPNDIPRVPTIKSSIPHYVVRLEQVWCNGKRVDTTIEYAILDTGSNICVVPNASHFDGALDLVFENNVKLSITPDAADFVTGSPYGEKLMVIGSPWMQNMCVWFSETGICFKQFSSSHTEPFMYILMGVCLIGLIAWTIRARYAMKNTVKEGTDSDTDSALVLDTDDVPADGTGFS